MTCLKSNCFVWKRDQLSIKALSNLSSETALYSISHVLCGTCLHSTTSTSWMRLKNRPNYVKKCLFKNSQKTGLTLNILRNLIGSMITSPMSLYKIQLQVISYKSIKVLYIVFLIRMKTNKLRPGLSIWRKLTGKMILISRILQHWWEGRGKFWRKYRSIKPRLTLIL